jgi:hypothetical protein
MNQEGQIIVTKVFPKSQGEALGVRVGDIITGVNEVSVRALPDLPAPFTYINFVKYISELPKPITLNFNVEPDCTDQDYKNLKTIRKSAVKMLPSCLPGPTVAQLGPYATNRFGMNKLNYAQKARMAEEARFRQQQVQQQQTEAQKKAEEDKIAQSIQPLADYAPATSQKLVANQRTPPKDHTGLSENIRKVIIMVPLRV